MEMKTELGQSLRQGRRHRLGIMPSLEHEQIVVGVPDQPDMAGRVPPLPLLYPEIEHIMQEDVGKQRADARALGRSFHRIGVHATLQDAGAEPLADQPRGSAIR